MWLQEVGIHVYSERVCECVFSLQYSWCAQVFPKPVLLLSDVFVQGLDAVPLGRCLATVEGQRDGLNTLIELRQASTPQIVASLE